MNIYLKKQQPDPPINYAGYILPISGMGKTIKPEIDLSNYPSLVNLGGIVLPPDVAIYLDVTEHIGRKPYEIEFEMVIRTQDVYTREYIFPQKELENIWNKIWAPNSVVSIQNTYLNGLGIEEMIIEKVTPTTIRGSKNLPLRIKGIENVKGLSLKIT